MLFQSIRDHLHLMKGFGGGGREDWRYWSSEFFTGIGAAWEGDTLD